MTLVRRPEPLPAWHTDRADYAHRNDTHWTRSDSLPAYRQDR
ncbi:hypothetical protein [Streptomyces sp. NPDC001153]